MAVVLPLPLGPISAWISPGRSSRSMPCRIPSGSESPRAVSEPSSPDGGGADSLGAPDEPRGRIRATTCGRSHRQATSAAAVTTPLAASAEIPVSLSASATRGIPAITANASSGPATGAPAPTITAANSCSASNGDMSAGAATPINNEKPAPAAAPNAPASASSPALRAATGTPAASAASGSSRNAMASRPPDPPRSRAAARRASAHRITATTACAVGVSVSDAPNQVSTWSSAGRVRPCVPPESSGNASNAVDASQARPHVASATRARSARATSAPSSHPPSAPPITATSTALPIDNPARSSCIAPTAPSARNALWASTGIPA